MLRCLAVAFAVLAISSTAFHPVDEAGCALQVAEHSSLGDEKPRNVRPVSKVQLSETAEEKRHSGIHLPVTLSETAENSDAVKTGYEALCGLDDLSWDTTQQMVITNIQVKNALYALCVQPDFGYSTQLCSVVMDEAFKLTEDSGIFDEVAQCPQVRGLVEEHFRHQTFLHSTLPTLLQRAGTAGSSSKLDTAMRGKPAYNRFKPPKFP